MSFLKSVYNRMNVNSSTLSGATDVIVVIHEDGTYLCSLFRVRFGKMSILSRASGNRMVSIRVNDKLVDQKMRVGSDGEAYFLSELLLDENGEYMSPAGMSPVSSMLNLSEEAGSSPPPLAEHPSETSPHLAGKSYILWNTIPSITNKQVRDDITHRMQLIRNMTIEPTNSVLPSPSTDTVNHTPVWSQKITANILRRKNYQYAITLTRGKTLLLNYSVFQHDVGFSAYFNSKQQGDNKTECIELCGYQYALSSAGYYSYLFTAPDDGILSMTWDNSYSYFNKKIVQIEMYVFEGEVPRCMTINYQTRYGMMRLDRIREDGVAELHSIQTDALLLYAPITTLSNPIVTMCEKDVIPEEELDEEEDEEVEVSSEHSPPPLSDELHVPAVMISLCRDQYREGMKEKDLDEIILSNRVSFSDIIDNPSLLEHPNVMFFCDRTPISLEEASSRIIEMAKEADRLNVISTTTSRDRKPLKSFRVSSEVLKEWPLVEGENDLAFIADADERCVVRCKLYLLHEDAKIVISDVDGTVTKEDVMGHVMYALHQDYTQKGIVRMYNRIDENGYVILYLTARAVGQMKDTRKYLEGIEQDGMHMPKGPIICSPNRTFASLIREVVRRKPQEFKIPVLRSISDTFTLESSPFVGGFGNRPTDEQSYVQAGVDKTKIFIINTKGDIRYTTAEGEAKMTNFAELVEICDQFFPPLALTQRRVAIEDNTKDAV